MKKLLLFVLTLSFTVPIFSQDIEIETETETTTYYFIRHAEKDRTDKTNRDPHLTEVGKTRAKKWSSVFGQIKFDAVYSTNYNRTKETAQPTATKNEVEITFYDSRNMDSKTFMNDTKGKTVLIVGHSNTTPMFANAVIGKKKYELIDDNNNGNLYIITITNNTITNQLLVIN